MMYAGQEVNGTTGFGEPSDFLETGEKLLLLFVLVTLIILGMIANVFVLYVVIVSSRRHAAGVLVPTNLFVLNQSLAHLANSFSTICFIVHLFRWIWEMVYVILTFTLFSSLGGLCLMTLDRFVSISRPLRYPKIMTTSRATFLVMFTWTAAVIVATLHLAGYLLHSDANFFNYGRYYITFLVLVFAVCNCYIFRQSRRHSARIRNTIRPLCTGLQQNLKEDLKSARTLAMVGSAFALSWLPLLLLFFLQGDEKEKRSFQRYAAFFSPLTIVNSISDPLIYHVRSAQFRRFYQTWKRKRRSMLTRSFLVATHRSDVQRTHIT